MVEAVALNWFWKLMATLPGFLLRWWYPREALARHLRIDVRPRHSPVQISGGDVSEATIWLQIQNTGPFHMELDRMIVQLNLAGYPLDYYMLDRTAIRPASTIEVYVRGPIPPGVLRHYALNIKNGDIVSLQVRAEFNCKVRDFTVRTETLSGIQPRNLNIPNQAAVA
jgi:hypothetical protein